MRCKFVVQKKETAFACLEKNRYKYEFITLESSRLQ